MTLKYDDFFSRLDFYEGDMYDVKNDTDMECLPYTSFADMMSDKGYTNILMKPVDRFFNKTEELVRPLRDTLKGLRSQLLLNVQVRETILDGMLNFPEKG